MITHDFRLDPSLTKDNDGNWIEDENIKIFDLTYEELLKFDVGSINKLSSFLEKKTEVITIIPLIITKCMLSRRVYLIENGSNVGLSEV